MYRRLVEPYVRRRAAAYEEAKLNGFVPDDDNADSEIPGVDINKVDVKAWKRCMEQWEKEVAVREKEGVSRALPAYRLVLTRTGQCHPENATRASRRFLHPGDLP